MALDSTFTILQNFLVKQSRVGCTTCGERNGQNNDTGELKRIEKLVSGAAGSRDIGKCCCAIQSLQEYLADENPIVKLAAAQGIAKLVLEAANLLHTVSDPEKLKFYTELLSDAIQSVKESGVNLDSNSKGALKEAEIVINQVKELLKGNGEETKTFEISTRGKNNKSDQFMGFSDRNTPQYAFCDKFESSIRRTADAISGGMTYDQFVGSLNNTRDNITGGMTPTQYKGSINQILRNLRGEF